VRGARIIDVSVANRPGMYVYPGDPPLEAEPVSRLDAGDPYALVRLGLGNHTGTHVDAPAHVLPGGARLGAVPLERLVGEALVADLRGRASIDEAAVAALPLGVADILLCRTDSWSWEASGAPSVPAHLTEGAADRLVARGVRAVGIDAPSVDRVGDRRLPVHRRLLGAGVIVVEGLDLRRAEPGRYTLVCLPLSFPDLDGTPARAVLLAGASALATHDPLP
jgi:arylformamidase